MTPMKIVTLFLTLLLTTPSAFGKAAFYGKKETIEKSEAIAIVNITKVEMARVKRGGWTYSERAHATVERTLKGGLAGKATLHGGENFICAQVRYEPGRHLVFLRRDGDLWCGVNWHFGVRKIKKDKLDWFADDTSLKLETAELNSVVEQIEAILKEP